MKKLLLISLSFCSLASAKFDPYAFAKKDDNGKFDYCESRYQQGLKKHGKTAHLRHPAYISEKTICCSNIDQTKLNADRLVTYDNSTNWNGCKSMYS